MRTTLTLDDDVAAEIEAVRKARDVALKDIVNEALRLGLRELAAPKKPREPFRTQAFDCGEPLIENLDNVEGVLSAVEGDWRK